MKSLAVLLLLCIAGLKSAKQSISFSGSKIVKDGEVLVDCYPEDGSNQQGCESRGCIWQPNDDPSINPPWCIVPSGYGYQSNGDPVDTDLGYTLNITRKSNQTSFYGGDIDNIRLTVEYWSENIVRIKFDDPNNARYEVPIPLAFQPSSKPTTTDYEVTYVDSPQFGIVVTRKSTGAAVFNTNQPGFVFADQFLQVTTMPPSSTIYGYGEQLHGHYLHDMNFKTWTAWNLDNAPMGNNEDNLYGTQPFYLNVESDGNANGVFLFNSNAQEFVSQPAPALTFRTIGGILDFYVYLGPSPEGVVKQHHSLVGFPLLPSYWFLGFQLGRNGYTNTDAIRQVVQNMLAFQIPYDVQLCGSEAYNDWMDFTINPNGFADLPELIDELHANDLRYIPLVFTCISGNSIIIGHYPPLDDGLAADIFIKFPNGTILKGQCSGGSSYYPDFSNSDADEYWSTELLKFYNDVGVKFDGIWIIANEPDNFATGSSTGCANNNLNNPPYPTHAEEVTYNGLNYKTICMEAVQAFGIHYDVHNLYGYSGDKSTYAALQAVFPGKRPNIVTRSTFATSGKYAAHSLGDNESTFKSMRDSIPAMLEFNLFGIPMVGAEICGFNGNTWVELCIRWHQLGAFYPYSRNNNAGSVAQDPPSLGPEVVDATKAALNERYRLLPYLYTLLHDSHTSGGTVARPVVHEYPADAQTYDINYQFLWGPALYISPVVDEGATNVNIYFPNDRWYNYYTGAQVSTVGTTIVVDAPLDGTIPLHVRGGYILPTQDPSVTTDLSRLNPFGLLVALDDNEAASGYQFWDDGQTLDTDVSGAFNTLTFDVAAGTLTIQATATGGGDMGAPLNTVKIFGVSTAPTTVTADGAPVNSGSINYDSTNKVLTLTDLNLSLPDDHTVTFN